MNTRTVIRATVRRVLESSYAAEWSVQGLGMLRLYLTPEVRLHIWHQRFRVPGVSAIHDHPWDFRSYIASGVVRQYRYVEGPGHGASGQPLLPFMRQTIRCGPGGCAIEQPVPALLRRQPLEEFRAGDWYEQFADEIHESRPEDGTVTIVERHFRSDTEHAHVYFDGPEWVSAEPRPALQSEIAYGIVAALERWDGWP